MIACLMLISCALAEEAGEASRLPAPEEGAEIESVDAVEVTGSAEAEAAEASEEAEEGEDPSEADAAEDTAEPAEDAPEATEIPEAESTPEPDGTEEPESTPEPEDCEVWFEEGFGLTLPGGWVSYDVSDEDRESGVRYALGDGTGERMLYIQFKAVGASDAALKLVCEDTAFVTFIDARQNASCCATLWGGEMAAFVFTPQSDSDFMLTASQLMESFKIL